MLGIEGISSAKSLSQDALAGRGLGFDKEMYPMGKQTAWEMD